MTKDFKRRQSYPVGGMKPTPNEPGLAGINRAQRVYVMPSGGGFSCYGFDVLKRKTAALAAYAGRPDLAPPIRTGTRKAWRVYQAASAAGRAHYDRTKERATFELTPALIGLEGRRVEVTEPGEPPRRFIVGKSTGWTPVHLEISRRDSHGGPAVFLSPRARVRVVA